MGPPIIMKNCDHRGLLIPTVFRPTSMPNPEWKEGTDVPKILPVSVTVQAICIGCQFLINFGVPKEPKI